MLVSDSFKIAKYLEKTYPDLERAVFPAFHAIVEKQIYRTAYPVMMSFVFMGILEAQPPGSRDEYLSGFGGHPDSIHRAGLPGSEERNAAIKKVQEALQGMGQVLAQNSEGPCFVGSKPTYADFAMLAALMLLKTFGRDLWEEVKTWEGGRWEVYVQAAEPWL